MALEQQEKPYTFEQLEEFAEFIRNNVDHRHPTIGIISGTGQEALAEAVKDAKSIPYQDIQGFPRSTVPGHAGEFVVGKLHGKEVIVMSGRLHIYEGYPAWKVTAPIRVMQLLGVKTLIICSAVGGMNKSYNVGDMIVLKDQIYLPGLCGNNPLIGSNDDRFGPRFLNVSSLFSKTLRKIAKEAAKTLGYESITKEGVYVMVTGPMFETSAELNFLRMIGGDVVGMSMAPETTVACHGGIEVLGISLVTDMAFTDDDGDIPSVSHEEVLAVSKSRGNDMKCLIDKIVEMI